MRLDITQRNIDEGSQDSSRNCAIARAIRDTGASDVIVSSDVAYIEHNRFDLGDEGREFVRRFDADKSLVSPIQLTISPYFGSSQAVYQWRVVRPSMSMAPLYSMQTVGVPPDSMMIEEYVKVPQSMFSGMDLSA